MLAATPRHDPVAHGEPKPRRRSDLTARRRTAPEHTGAANRALHASGRRGELWFRLQRHPEGLYVEREERPCRGRSCLQSLHFRHASDFERWFDDDPVRFEHPLLHHDLKRSAAELWQLADRSASDG